MAEIDERAERRASLVNASVCKGKLLLLWVAALILLISAVCVYFRHGNLAYDYGKVGGKTIAFIDIFSSQTGYYMKTFIPLLLPIVLIATVIFITVITKTFNAKLDLYILITVTVLLTLTLVIVCVCNVQIKADSSASIYNNDGYIWVKGNKSYYSEFRFEPGMLAALILYLSSGTAFLIFLVSVLSGLNEDTPEEKLFFAGRLPSEFNK